MSWKDCLVVIPTYNEVETIYEVVDRVVGDGFAVLIVDDNSPDGTGELADQLDSSYGARVDVWHRPEKQGLGKAYLAGFSWALRWSPYAYIGQMDADLSHPPERLKDLYTIAQLPGVDLALGSRYKPGGGLDQGWSPLRRALSRWANTYARLLLRTDISDWTGAFKVWTRPLLKAVLDRKPRGKGYCSQIEMTYLAVQEGAAVVEVPFYFKDREKGQSKMSWAITAEAAARVLAMGLLPRRNGKHD